MSNIKEFKIVRGTIASVEQIVSGLLVLDNGWEPRGVTFKMEVDKQEIVVQAMVRRESATEELEDA